MRTLNDNNKCIIRYLKLFLIIEAIIFGWLLLQLSQAISTTTYYNEIAFVPRPKTIKEKIAQYDWDVDIAYAVMMAESDADSQAVNEKDSHASCNGSYGLFQLACFWGDTQDLLDENINIEVAYIIYSKQGWKPWGAYSDKRYLAYLQ